MSENKQQTYDRLFQRLDALCAGETDAVALMATIACELYHSFDTFHWVGFYRSVGDRTLKIGPYQGSHGCLTIPFDKGVCGQCARELRVVNVPDVSRIQHHIACSGSTRSEIVVPVQNAAGALLGVLDIDSDLPAAFDAADERNLALLNRYFERAS
jgi:L-methionine (R)-S-oxide reductase